ncbi:MAG: GldG family protein [Deltaproteobacteria bacterium]
MNAPWQQWLRLVLATAGLVVLLVVLVATAYMFNLRVDLSPGGRFTLSDHALAVLHGLDEPVHVTSFIRTEDSRNPVLKDLLWQASHENPLLSYELVDINRHPALASTKGVNSYGASVVESAGRRADFSQPTEAQLVSAIAHVSHEAKKVYVLGGHGECAMENTDRHRGCSEMAHSISAEFYEVAELNLLAVDDVPADASVVIIAGPASDLLEGELAKLARYLDRGGDLLVMLDPFKATGLGTLLGEYGIDVHDDVVLDPDHRLSGGEPFSLVLVDRNRHHLLSGTLDAPPLFSGARSFGGRDDEASGRVITRLLKSGPRSWASHDPGVLAGKEPRFVGGRDINGPLVLGIEVSARPRAEGVAGGERTRIVAFGDSGFATNRFLEYLGNKDLLVNSVNWLAKEEQLISTRAKRKTPGRNQFFVSQAEGRRVFLGAVVYEPLFFMLVGIGVMLRRRLRP